MVVKSIEWLEILLARCVPNRDIEAVNRFCVAVDDSSLFVEGGKGVVRVASDKWRLAYSWIS